MQVTLEIRTGPAAGKRVVVQPGQAVKVGRVDPADFLIRGDAMLSNVHFEVTCDDQGGQVRDLGSRFGTFVNKERVTEAGLKEGDQISAGETTFEVRLGSRRSVTVVAPPVPSTAPVAAVPPAETFPPPTKAPPAPGPEPPGTIHDRVLAILREQPEPLFALLDAARTPRILELLRDLGAEFQSLYEGEKGEALSPWAPHLVTLPPGSPVLEPLVQEGWGKSWGVFVTCHQPFGELRKHFRRFLLVELPDGRQVYFRFYDPRVLRVFLPTCAPSESTEFFGPVCRLVVEAEQAESLLSFTDEGHGVVLRSVGLAPDNLLRTEESTR
jgi:Domain of unknown function (DUF4123)/FHA domain